jgi:cytochrome c oxidase subunit III
MTTTVDRPDTPAPAAARISAARGPDGNSRPPAWWGMMMLVVTEGMVFVGLFSAYFFMRATTHSWPGHGIEPPELWRPALFSILLIGSSVPIVLSEHAARRDDQPKLRAYLAIAWLMAAAFLANQVLEYRTLGFGPHDNIYASLFWFITGLHGLHVLAALVMSAVVQAKAWTGRITSRTNMTLRVFGIYWHFVDGVWIVVFASLYLSAHIGAHG